MCATVMVGVGSKENPTGWTEEHCVPRWLQRHLRIGGIVGATSHHGSEDEFAHVLDLADAPKRGEKSPRRHPPYERLVHSNVCRRCNQGWMSDLEGEVQQTLMALADGRVNVRDLDAQQRGVLARWAMKTAFVWAEASTRKGHTPFIPASHAQSIMNGLGVPQTVSVFGMSHHLPATIAAHASRTSMIQHAPGTTEEKILEHRRKNLLYKCSFLIGKLLLTVMHCPASEGAIVVWPGVHHQIWPLEPRALEADWLMPFPLIAPFPLLAFHLSLNVAASAHPWENVLESRNTGGGSVTRYSHEHALIDFVDQEAVLGHPPWGDKISFKRGEKCPCDSGRAFDRCHGRLES